MSDLLMLSLAAKEWPGTRRGEAALAVLHPSGLDQPDETPAKVAAFAQAAGMLDLHEGITGNLPTPRLAAPDGIDLSDDGVLRVGGVDFRLPDDPGIHEWLALVMLEGFALVCASTRPLDGRIVTPRDVGLALDTLFPRAQRRASEVYTASVGMV